MIQQKIEPGYNPRRLIRKVMMGLDQDACKDKTTWLCSACDLCYPACPQKIHISEVIGAIKSLAIEAGHTSPIKTAVVNEQTCVACGLCVEVCPYNALTLQPIPIGRTGGKEFFVARVNASLCMACGLCAASCRSTSIGLPDEFSNESLIGELWNWVKSPVFEEEEVEVEEDEEGEVEGREGREGREGESGREGELTNVDFFVGDTQSPAKGLSSPPFVKGDLGGFLGKSEQIPPNPPLQKGGIKTLPLSGWGEGESEKCSNASRSNASRSNSLRSNALCSNSLRSNALTQKGEKGEVDRGEEEK